MDNNNLYLTFYENIDRINRYAVCTKPEHHRAYKHIIRFINDYGLRDKKCLEIGSSIGLFQDLVKDYTGLDVAKSLTKYYHKPYFLINEDGSYPFEDNEFEAIWSYEVHEHIPDLNQALLEMKRVLKPGGVVFFAPAWQCRTWAAEGYAVRQYSELNLKEKIIKALIPITDSLVWRALWILPKRLYRHMMFIFGKRYEKIQYNKLKPNYVNYWTSDSDACNSIEAHDAILWFESNGFKCVSHPRHFKSLFLRHGLLIFKKYC